MRGPKAPQVIVSARQRTILERFARSRTVSVSLVERCNIILLAAEGMATLHAAAKLGVDRQRVRRWRQRWASSLYFDLLAIEGESDDKALATAIEAALADGARTGAPPTFSPEQIARVRAIADKPPAAFGLSQTRWTRSLIAQVAVAEGIVASVSVAEVGRWLRGGA